MQNRVFRLNTLHINAFTPSNTIGSVLAIPLSQLLLPVYLKWMEFKMKGKILRIVKKWWALALVLTLALSLTSCSKRRSRYDFAAFTCDGTLGSFDTYVIPNSAGKYDLVVIPYQLAVSQPIIQVGLVNSQNNTFKVLEYQVVAQPNAEISKEITYSDLVNFDYLAIRPANGGAFSDWSNVAADAVCVLQMPENLTSTNQF